MCKTRLKKFHMKKNRNRVYGMKKNVYGLPECEPFVVDWQWSLDRLNYSKVFKDSLRIVFKSSFHSVCCIIFAEFRRKSVVCYYTVYTRGMHGWCVLNNWDKIKFRVHTKSSVVAISTKIWWQFVVPVNMDFVNKYTYELIAINCVAKCLWLQVVYRPVYGSVSRAGWFKNKNAVWCFRVCKFDVLTRHNACGFCYCIKWKRNRRFVQISDMEKLVNICVSRVKINV